ncbi:hypothetical protein ASZ90_012516 [hydrocarbon metagenome]|uniref:Uncharacterized protein n=1 Tax=hydrocarbon metagenome TaxID=938273 RepID=A0A0W8FBN5_9ZZZZ
MIIIILIACDRMCPAYITYLGDCAQDRNKTSLKERIGYSFRG